MRLFQRKLTYFPWLSDYLQFNMVFHQLKQRLPRSWNHFKVKFMFKPPPTWISSDGSKVWRVHHKHCLDFRGGALPETNKSPWKWWFPIEISELPGSIFRGELLVSGRVMFTIENPQKGRLYYTKPIGSMYGISTYIWPQKWNRCIGKYTIYGWYGKDI